MGLVHPPLSPLSLPRSLSGILSFSEVNLDLWRVVVKFPEYPKKLVQLSENKKEKKKRKKTDQRH